MAKVNLLADVVLIAVGLTVAGMLLSRSSTPPATAPTIPLELLSEEDRFVGKLYAFDQVDWTAAEHTLVLSLDSECMFCTESIPFYRRVQTHDGVTSDVQIVVVAPFYDLEMEDYLVEQGLQPDEVVMVNELNTLPDSGTPTLLLVDRDGLVTHAWIGLLSSDREEEVLTAVFG